MTDNKKTLNYPIASETYKYIAMINDIKPLIKT